MVFLTGGRMEGFLAELKSDLNSKAPFTIWVVCSGILAATGPFGTYATVNLLTRFAYWLPAVAVCVGIATVIRAFVSAGLRLGASLAGFVLTTVLICAVICPPLYLASNVLFADRQPSLPGMTEIVLLVGSVSMGIILLRQSVREEASASTDDEGAVADDMLRLMRRIDPALRGDLWSITVNNHHVEVVTSAGRSNVLMRFGDAIQEAESTEGLQVHRSFWVACAAIEGYEREGTRLFLRVKPGQQIPVSRGHRAKVEDYLGIAPQVADRAISSAA